MTFCQGCGDDIDGCEEVTSTFTHRWVRCSSCGKMNQLRVQEIRGRRMQSSRADLSTYEYSNEFSGEIET